MATDGQDITIKSERADITPAEHALLLAQIVMLGAVLETKRQECNALRAAWEAARKDLERSRQADEVLLPTLRRAKEILGAGNFDNIDHAAARVVSERDEALELGAQVSRSLGASIVAEGAANRRAKAAQARCEALEKALAGLISQGELWEVSPHQCPSCDEIGEHRDVCRMIPALNSARAALAAPDGQ